MVCAEQLTIASKSLQVAAELDSFGIVVVFQALMPAWVHSAFKQATAIVRCKSSYPRPLC